ncbi:hypothetical protein C475_08837 [Halosimplex carlsbadense 2-9-1]|uniref:Uncharacterized protein n=1 Tax=Halosimplex carlsbadense 2-9-1 TaxID=797114 RepID=M0CXC7_9EURY|nr:hypothetical protein C475_08837 [Halosimplex carlsbadense 2-9-1]
MTETDPDKLERARDGLADLHAMIEEIREEHPMRETTRRAERVLRGLDAAELVLDDWEDYEPVPDSHLTHDDVRDRLTEIVNDCNRVADDDAVRDDPDVRPYVEMAEFILFNAVESEPESPGGVYRESLRLAALALEHARDATDDYTAMEEVEEVIVAIDDIQRALFNAGDLAAG